MLIFPFWTYILSFYWSVETEFQGSDADKQQIARDHPDEIQVMNHQSFFWPMWYGSEIEDTHEKDEYNFRATGQYA